MPTQFDDFPLQSKMRLSSVFVCWVMACLLIFCIPASVVWYFLWIENQILFGLLIGVFVWLCSAYVFLRECVPICFAVAIYPNEVRLRRIFSSCELVIDDHAIFEHTRLVATSEFEGTAIVNWLFGADRGIRIEICGDTVFYLRGDMRNGNEFEPRLWAALEAIKRAGREGIRYHPGGVE
ncbi:MAG: hypothetical protein R3C53_09915 [Pirellulaceae bacterium]